ncbi:unnamed protein product [Rotaria magnacalcarata]|uniref:Uncharacterized protein n=2 Tax=Rotaria magnacalcarata TaxID=392030 RepID=A0A814JLZ7_9BILA|nr:unnamed protein product [Rotaria magnacalcarata]CAF3758263.1 unnamed protein product [Rotaria magnacalcarata]
MTKSRALKKESHYPVHVKSDPFQIDVMASPKKQFSNVFEHVDYADVDKLKLLNDLINNSQPTEMKLKYYSERAMIRFNTCKWDEVLSDIAVIEKHQTLSDSLLLIKCKSSLHHEAHKIRDTLRSTMGLKLLDNKDHMMFFNAISPETINKLIGKKKHKRNNLKRLQP